tara:strand:+ start:275 stop:892 length:618 start_codon:yes stop_codon:yes gene_type:complete
MAQKLLVEYSVFTPTKTHINEGLAGGKNMLVEGIVQRAEEFNHNGRRYPFEVLKREVDKYIDGPIAENRALGELDHPESSVINLKNACHNIKELYWEGNDLMGKIEVLPTPSGNILKQLFENNITVGISSRGMGSVNQLGEGRVEVDDDFELLCWDFVSTPSTHGAFMKPAGLNEGYNPSTFKYSALNSILSDIICTQSGICCLR